MERLLPETSLTAYQDKELQKERNNTKRAILSYLCQGNTGTTRELSKAINIDYTEVQKRVSDLLKEGRITVCGTKPEGSKNILNSQYKFYSFRVQKQQKSQFAIFKEMLMTDYPEIYKLIKPKAEQVYKNQ